MAAMTGHGAMVAISHNRPDDWRLLRNENVLSISLVQDTCPHESGESSMNVLWPGHEAVNLPKKCNVIYLMYSASSWP